MIPLQLEPAFAGNNPALAGTADFSRKTKPPPLGGGAFTIKDGSSVSSYDQPILAEPF